jgi:rhodanese-related sulfurtransferase
MLETSAEWNTFEIDAPTLAHWMRQGEVVLIDVREPEEHHEERIPGAVLVPLSSFDPCLLADCYGNKTIVLHCLAGSRAEKAAAMFASSGHAPPATLRDGLLGWQGAGLPTEGADAPTC